MQRGVIYGCKVLGNNARRLFNTYCASLSSRNSCLSDNHGTTEATLYVHWPYCERRCTYCNFNKYISKSVDHDRMQACLLTETATLLDLSGVQSIRSIFFGGGTPSLARPSTLGSIVDLVAQKTHLPDGVEITLEANPTSAEASKLAEFKAVGINRVSIGIQSLAEEDLRVLGRDHSVEEALRCLEVSKELFPGRTSVDLIFGRPNQTPDSFRGELEKLLALSDDHISLYQLTLERGTALFKKVMDRELAVPSAEKMADLYSLAVEELTAAGFHRYEASNFARTKLAESSHNKAYWEGRQYIGVGPGAHGRFVVDNQREARVQTLEPDNWMWEVEKFGHATRRSQKLEPYLVLQEILYLGLRTKAGIPNERWMLYSGGVSLEEVYGEVYMIRSMQKEGYLKPIKGCLQLTERGLDIVDSVARELLDILDQYWMEHVNDGADESK